MSTPVWDGTIWLSAHLFSSALTILAGTYLCLVTLSEFMSPGHFYAVGVGPGSSDLLTFRAANLIESADIVIAPRSKRSETSLALKTVEHLITSQQVVDHVYAINRDYTETMKWIDKDSKVIPGLGVMKEGVIREMPDEQAESYKAQGLMEEVKSTVKKQTKKED